MNLSEFILSSPTPFHAVDTAKKMLEEQGFTELKESENLKPVPGGKYFLTRNLSSLIALKIPEGDFCGFMISAAHSDSPAFKVKENSEMSDGNYVSISSERYGGMLCSTWLDRPLSVAGRVIVKTEKGVESRLVDLKEPVAIMPNVAIHMNRNANSGAVYDFAVDMIPLMRLAGSGQTLKSRIAENAGVSENSLLSWDLILYNPEKPVIWGDFITSPRLDDLQCAYASLAAFLKSKNEKSAAVYALFDNEEVGSETKQGAASTFLFDTLSRVAGADLRLKLASSMLASCDNAHAIHPNHPEYSDKNHAVTMNGGVVIKYNANQKYTSDGVSTALFALICRKAGVKVQYYANRPDMAGGSTLGNISNTQVSVNAVDIGIAQLAMHSALETAGKDDTDSMISALTEFFSTSVVFEKDGTYLLV